jgi:glucose-6-phosphate 1-dehydrogenase
MRLSERMQLTAVAQVEKPFGKDLPSSRELQRALAPDWTEDELYRIDHYLGKEMVKNILILRFGNEFFGATWNRNHIDNVQVGERYRIHGKRILTSVDHIQGAFRDRRTRRLL